MKKQLKAGQYRLSDLQINSLAAAAFSPRDRLFVMLMSGAGLRRSEVLNLRCGDILEDPALSVRGKGNKIRYIPIKPELYQELKFFIGRRAGLVFPSKRDPHKPLTPCLVNKVLADIGRAARVNNPDPSHDVINCHILRHSYARGLKAAGLSMETIKNIMGHSSIKTTMDVYGLMSNKDIAKEFNDKVS